MAITPTTWNPADKDSTVTLSGGDLTADSTYGSVRSVAGVSAGKFYWEITFPSGISQQRVGVATGSADISYYPGYDSHSWALNLLTGNVENNGSPVYTLSVSPTTTLSILLDADAQTITFWSDGVAASTAISLTAGPYFAVYGYYAPVEANFGASAFTYTPPAGYEPGLGVITGPSVYPVGAAVFAAGTPTLITPHPVTISPIGQRIIKFGNTAVVPGPNRVSQASGVAVTKTGAPSVIEGPNRIAGVQGVSCLSAGTPYVQLGYPETLLPSGISAFSAGAPTVFPYSNRTVQAAGASLFQAGYPSVRYDPIIDGTEFIVPSGARVFSAGVPAMVAAATVQPQGAAVFSAGAPSVKVSIGVSGVSLVSTGTPSIGVEVLAAGVSLVHTGTPKIVATVAPAGKAVLRAGTPSLIAGEFVIQPPGAAVFSAGLPRISNMTIHPWGKSHLRTGTPKAIRGTKC